MSDIITALRSPRIFGGAFKSLRSWHSWEVFLAAVFRLPIAAGPDLELFQKATGLGRPPTQPAREVFCVSGRRSGKSRIAALLAVWQAAFRDWRGILGPGERGKAVIIAVDRAQAKIIRDYISGLLHGTPALRALIQAEARDRIELTTWIDIEIMTADFRSLRGRTIVFAAMEELAFWQPDETSSNPAAEIFRALKPSLATAPGSLLLGISTAYSRSGLLYEQVQKFHGRPGSTLIWVSDSRTMNPTLSQELIESELAADPAAARAEWLSIFRDDVSSFLGIDLLRSAIVESRTGDTPVRRGAAVVGFIDPSGGRQDSYSAAVASIDAAGRVTINGTREAKPPFSPEQVTADFAAFFKTYGVNEVTSDRWGGAWVEEMWGKTSIGIRIAELTASDYYLNFLALLSSGRVELPDNPHLQAQLLQLERRVRPGGKDSVSHPPGLHDDLANAVAGAAVTASMAQANGAFLGIIDDVWPADHGEGRYGPTREGMMDWIHNSRKIR